ncbi:TetR/AcrR family transcriptional regulator [Pseudonocardia sp.]|jgi:AcrR family transcriptional regulator|uniref:TetR/AcrR family transcriptional regulator n=1 Tax=Pseudonocardia sp. TaxID=60912 RepID=UPI00260178AF|nr:TetR/AcrR family transcriptional regulator [Pseudonocardia sp.]MCW2722135.1 TetR family transcriptional regulator [Pseudonocardia sp.]
MSDAPVSRRQRPAKPALSREAIVGAAVALLRTEGLERLTMRRLAAVLDTGPASLYVYVRNTEALHAAVLDELLGTVDLDGGDLEGEGSWRERLHALLTSYTAVLVAFPSVARLSVFTRPSGPNYLRLLDTLLGLLAEGGLGPKQCAWGVDLLLLHATTIAAEHGTRRERPGAEEEDSDLVAALASVSADTHPQLYRAVHRGPDGITGGTGADRFAWAVDVLLDGFLASAGQDA